MTGEIAGQRPNKPMKHLGKITEDLAIEAARADPGRLQIAHVTDDSRDVRPGTLFIARPGIAHDGRRFIADAIAAGAVAVLTDPSVAPEDHPETHFGAVALLHAADVAAVAPHVAERFHANPSRTLTCIGVTGTNGKTTITHIIKHALDALGFPAGLIGTVAIDDGRASIPATLTTPSAIELSATLARMRDHACRAAVIEASSHALHQGRTAALDIDVAVFSNLSGDHLDYHQTLEAYADAKAILFDNLRRDAVAIVNADDRAHARITRRCRAPVLRTSRRADADYTIAPESLSLDGLAADVRTPSARVRLESPLVGEHNLMNLLQAVAVLDHLGFTADAVAGALARVGPPPGRLEPVRPDGPDAPFTVLVDYAHTDDALDNTLRAVRPFTGGALRLVFGCGGDRDRTKRPRMAAVAARHADHIVVTSDNPRTEDPGAIIEEILAGILAGARTRLTVEPDRRRAIETAVGDARPGDLVLIAGKGHEDHQILPDGRGGVVRRHFDDREVAADALRRRTASADHEHARARP